MAPPLTKRWCALLIATVASLTACSSALPGVAIPPVTVRSAAVGVPSTSPDPGPDTGVRDEPGASAASVSAASSSATPLSVAPVEASSTTSDVAPPLQSTSTGSSGSTVESPSTSVEASEPVTLGPGQTAIGAWRDQFLGFSRTLPTYTIFAYNTDGGSEELGAVEDIVPYQYVSDVPADAPSIRGLSRINGPTEVIQGDRLYVLAVQSHPASGLTKATSDLVVDVIDLAHPTAAGRLVKLTLPDDDTEFVTGAGTKMYSSQGDRMVDLTTGALTTVTLEYKKHPVVSVSGVLPDGSPVWTDQSVFGSFHAGRVTMSADDDVQNAGISGQLDPSGTFAVIRVSPQNGADDTSRADVYAVATDKKIATKLKIFNGNETFVMSPNGRYGIYGNTAFVAGGRSYFYPDSETTTGVAFWGVTDDGIADGDTASIDLKTGKLSTGPTLDPDGQTVTPEVFGRYWLNDDNTLWYDGARIGS